MEVGFLGVLFRKNCDYENGEVGVAPMVLHEVVHRNYWEPKLEGEGKCVELVTTLALVLHGWNLNRDYNIVNWDTLHWLRPIHAVVGELPGPDIDRSS